MLTKTGIGKKSDAHDSKESYRFASQLKKNQYLLDENLYLNKLESPFTKEWIVANLVEIDPVILEKKIFKFHQYIFAIS